MSASLLTIASYFGFELVVKHLLGTGKVDVNWKENESGETPLSFVAMNGREAVLKQLLGTGKVDVNPKDELGITPVWAAAGGGYEMIIQQLLDTGKVDVDSSPPGWAAGGKEYEAAAK